jgi:hypothetical protein
MLEYKQMQRKHPGCQKKSPFLIFLLFVRVPADILLEKSACDKLCNKAAFLYILRILQLMLPERFFYVANLGSRHTGIVESKYLQAYSVQ